MLLILALFSFSGGAVLADSYGRTVGAQAGHRYDTDCKEGDLLTGFRFGASNLLNSLTPLCGVLSGNAFTSEYALDEIGSSKGLGAGDRATRGALRCPPGMAVHQLGIYLAGSAYIRHISFSCYPLVKGQQPVYNKGTANSSGTDGSNANSICPPGGFAIGLAGTSTQYVISTSVHCETAEELMAAAPDDTQPAPPDDASPPPDDQQKRPPDDQSEAGPNERTAHEATTVYASPGGKEIAYLDNGTIVRIVECAGDGQRWCRIDRPQRGYVWGGDFD